MKPNLSRHNRYDRVLSYQREMQVVYLYMDQKA